MMRFTILSAVFLIATLAMMPEHLVFFSQTPIHYKDSSIMNIENVSEIYLAGGCFWGTEHFIKQLHGVVATEVGYANGKSDLPTYEQVKTGQTGFAETVHVYYKASEILLEEILSLYFLTIDPTSMNRQGGDFGTQYRTGIYYTRESDKPMIDSCLKKLQSEHDDPVVVEVTPLKNFFPAESYHQDYLDKNPQGYCHISLEIYDEIEEHNRKVPKKYAKPSDDELKQKLTDIQYKVTQQNGTEHPFQNAYYDEFREGIYVDITTREPLFVSTDKFESGCGWPSFSKPIQNYKIETLPDTSLGHLRTEVRSANSDAHLGHVFEDGPQALGGLRYCINSAALRFIPKDEMQKEGYGDLLHLLNKKH